MKPPLRIRDLPNFTLGVEDAARVALDFLRLEQHVKVSDWLAAHLVPPLQRVLEGKTLPLRDVHPLDVNLLEGTIDLAGYPLNRAALETRCSFAAGDFVRLAPCAADPARGQTLGQLLRAGSTGRIERLEWESGTVHLAVIAANGADRYLLRSGSWPEDREGFETATLDESPSDFVGGRVERRLQCGLGKHAYRWFDPRHPEIPPRCPLVPERLARYTELLQRLDLGHGLLAADQGHAALAGLETRVQLLQGPPGTGKTETTAIAVLLRVLARRGPGDFLLVTGPTHTAVDTLLERIAAVLPRFRAHVHHNQLPLPLIRLGRVYSTASGTYGGSEITQLAAGTCAAEINALREDATLVLGGTPGALLKLAEHLSDRRPWSQCPERFQVPALVVDEAGMLVLPYFLALASLVEEDGEFLLAGDPRQFQPIVSHEWQSEGRPPALVFQPNSSAYTAIQNLKVNHGLLDAQIRRSALRYSHRLPPPLRELLSRLYRLDGIELEGRPAEAEELTAETERPWERLWREPGGLFLVTHSERQSKQSNPVEAAIIGAILAAGERLQRLERGSVGIVMPHRAQRSLLKGCLNQYGEAVDVIDTVERLQGGEQDTVLVSATASDPLAIGARAEFVLSLNRANVAFSRARRRLVVVCAETLLAHIPPEVAQYEAALLWKSLRSLCSELVAEIHIGEHTVRLQTVAGAEPSGSGNGKFSASTVNA